MNQPDMHTVENPFGKPKRFNPKLGTHCIVSVRVKNVYPRQPLRDNYVNNYKHANKKMIIIVNVRVCLYLRIPTGQGTGI